MHFDLTSFLLGALIYGLLEALIIIIVVRFFPNKVGAIQRAADAFFRIFAHPQAFANTRSAEAVYGYNDEVLDEVADEGEEEDEDRG